MRSKCIEPGCETIINAANDVFCRDHRKCKFTGCKLPPKTKAVAAKYCKEHGELMVEAYNKKRREENKKPSKPLPMTGLTTAKGLWLQAYKDAR